MHWHCPHAAPGEVAVFCCACCKWSNLDHIQSRQHQNKMYYLAAGVQPPRSTHIGGATASSGIAGSAWAGMGSAGATTHSSATAWPRETPRDMTPVAQACHQSEPPPCTGCWLTKCECTPCPSCGRNTKVPTISSSNLVGQCRCPVPMWQEHVGLSLSYFPGQVAIDRWL